ncbi:MAG TPA: NAD-dependent malic enzyme, partial [Labilithrix sp.]|nr:NAD-dependent malic enzyme [Labilithrix sp.]
MVAARRLSRGIQVARDDEGELHLRVGVDGDLLLRCPLTNKGTAFTRAERTELRLDGLLPPRVESLETQATRAYALYLEAATPLAQSRFLRQLQDRNEVLFYFLLERHLREMLPIVYTPTVGEAVERFSHLFETPRGMSVTREDSEDIASVVAAYPCEDARMIVATDSSAILGIGDQGYNGLAIAIGKLALYTSGGGVSPFRTVPAVLDVGTDREDLLEDPLYLGVQRKRLRGDAYLAFIAKFVESVRQRWPHAIIQWEDFSKDAAFTVLDAFRDVVPSFNDDIQGTGAVALAGLLSACRLQGRQLGDERFLVLGAGAGGIGVARAIRGALLRDGLSAEEVRARIFVLDSRGLLVAGRTMEPYKCEFAQPAEALRGWVIAGSVPDLKETVEHAGITALLGLSGQPGAFSEAVVRSLANNSERPIVFALSNPTVSCEAHPADLLAWTSGRALVATGSPFDPVVRDGITHVIGQGNNAFIFPGLGFGAILAGARSITDRMVESAALALADYTSERWLAEGLLYPPIEDLREASVRVAAAVARAAVADGVAAAGALPEDLE